MLKITLHDAAGELRFRLEGRLAGPWVSELRQCWNAAASAAQSRPAVVDLREVDFVDSDGQELLSEIHRQGARLVAETPLIRALVQEIARAGRYATVEGKPARRPHAVVSPDTTGRDPRPL
jgi:anti-anti-sigma regulatory factor